MSLTVKGQITAIGQTKAGNIPPTTAPAVWSSTKKTSDWSLSNSDLSVTNAGGGIAPYGGAATTGGITTGKHYWEITIDSLGASGSPGDILFGVSKTSTWPDGSDWYIGSNKIVLIFGGTGTSQSLRSNDNGTLSEFTQHSAAYGQAPAIGKVIGVAFDADTRHLWVSMNGVWRSGMTITDVENGITTSATGKGLGTAGEYHAVVASDDSNTFGECAFTANFGQNAFAYPVPSGFNEGLLVNI